LQQKCSNPPKTKNPPAVCLQAFRFFIPPYLSSFSTNFTAEKYF